MRALDLADVAAVREARTARASRRPPPSFPAKPPPLPTPPPETPPADAQRNLLLALFPELATETVAAGEKGAAIGHAALPTGLRTPQQLDISSPISPISADSAALSLSARDVYGPAASDVTPASSLPYQSTLSHNAIPAPTHLTPSKSPHPCLHLDCSIIHACFGLPNQVPIACAQHRTPAMHNLTGRGRPRKSPHPSRSPERVFENGKEKEAPRGRCGVCGRKGVFGSSDGGERRCAAHKTKGMGRAGAAKAGKVAKGEGKATRRSARVISA